MAGNWVRITLRIEGMIKFTVASQLDNGGRMEYGLFKVVNTGCGYLNHPCWRFMYYICPIHVCVDFREEGKTECRGLKPC